MSYLITIIKVGGLTFTTQSFGAQVTASGLMERLEQPKPPTLEQLQRWVGGPIQPVPAFSKLEDQVRGQAWANEEGRVNGMPFMATGWWCASSYGGGPLTYVPLLHGDVVFVSKKPRT